MSLYRTGTTTFGPVSCCLMAAHLSSEGGQHFDHLGSCLPDTPHQSRADLLRTGLLRTGHQSRRQGVLLLLQRWKHRRLGPPQPDPRQVGLFQDFFSCELHFLMSLRLKARPFSKPFTFRDLQAISRPHRWCQLH